MLARLAAALFAVGNASTETCIQVLTPARQPLAEAEILSNGKSFKTGFDGTVRLPAGPFPYKVQVSADVFSPQTVTIEGPRADCVSVVLQLRMPGQVVEVQAGVDPLRGMGTVLSGEQIASLPDDPEELEAVLRQMAGPGVVIRVNGFSGGRLPHKSQIAEIRFRTNPLSADRHERSAVTIDITTRPADTWNLNVSSSAGNPRLDARPPLASGKPSGTHMSGSLALDGPLRAHRSSFALNLGVSRSVSGQAVNALTLPGPISLVTAVESHAYSGSARVQALHGQSHLFRAEYEWADRSQQHLGVGGTMLPSRGFSIGSVEHIFRASDQGGRRFVNSLASEVKIVNRSHRPDTLAPAIDVPGYFHEGGHPNTSQERAVTGWLEDSLERAVGPFAFSGGLRLDFWRLDLAGSSNRLGTFVYSDLDRYRSGLPTLITRRTGVIAVVRNQLGAGAFAEAQFRPSARFAASLGLRYEVQQHVSSAGRFVPRAVVAWRDPRGTSYRVGYGHFLDWFEPALYADLRRHDATDLASSDVELPFGVRRYKIDPHLRNPRTNHALISIERTILGAQTSLRYQRERSAEIYRSSKLDGVLVLGSTGHSKRDGLSLTTWWGGPTGPAHVLGQYSWSRTVNPADSPLSVPYAADPMDELGPAADDARHNFFSMVSARRKRVSVAATARVQSPTPYTIVLPTDENRDGSLNDRPAGMGRNSTRGGWRREVSLRLTWNSRAFRGKPTGSSLSAPLWRVSVAANNLLNSRNVLSYGSVWGTALFGQPLSALPGRMLSLSVSAAF